jgi:hypothetical protein
MTLLPVSGVAFSVREPTGEDEIYVLETTLAPLPAMLELASRVAGTDAGDPIDWASLPVTDIGAAALLIRQSWIGDMIRTDANCPGSSCRERIDVSFGVVDYLEHHRPRQPRSVTGAAEAGWFTLAGTTVRLRLPTAADLLAVSSGHPAKELSGRCIDAAEVSPALARRLDRALSALAPNLDDLVGGSCPGCGHQVLMRFDPLAYTLAELRQAFSGIHREAHELAAAYSWPEEAILALPRSRRQRYATLIADERRAG